MPYYKKKTPTNASTSAPSNSMWTARRYHPTSSSKWSTPKRYFYPPQQASQSLAHPMQFRSMASTTRTSRPVGTSHTILTNMLAYTNAIKSTQSNSQFHSQIQREPAVIQQSVVQQLSPHLPVSQSQERQSTTFKRHPTAQ